MSVKSGYAPKGRKDATHAGIMDVLKQAGWLVVDMSSVGRGVPDLLIGRWRQEQMVGPFFHYRLIEVKTGRKKPQKNQQDFAALGWPVTVLRSVDDAVKFVGGR